jgi:hypothetical protein
MVPEDGLEPSLLSKSDFESDVSTDFTTRAVPFKLYLALQKNLKKISLQNSRTTSLNEYQLSEQNYTHAYDNGKSFG